VIPAGFTDVTSRWGDRILTLKSVAGGNFVVADVDPGCSEALQVRTWNANLKKKFETRLTPDGYIAFRNLRNGKYVTANINEHNSPLQARKADDFARWECFRIYTDGRDYYLLSLASGCWVSADVNSENTPIVANALKPEAWERFHITESNLESGERK
jgi:hypothetical protein